MAAFGSPVPTDRCGFLAALGGCALLPGAAFAQAGAGRPGASAPAPIRPPDREATWGAGEFVSTGPLSDYGGEPLLARLDGSRTLFVAGQYDEARPATLAGFAERAPGASFAVIGDAGHSIPNDNPEALSATLGRWLRGHEL